METLWKPVRSSHGFVRATCNTPQAAIKSLAAAFAAQGLCGKDHTGTQQVGVLVLAAQSFADVI